MVTGCGRCLGGGGQMAGPLRTDVAAAWQTHFLSGKERPLAPLPGTSKEKTAGPIGATQPQSPSMRSHGPGKCTTGLCDRSRGTRQDLRGHWPRGLQGLQEDTSPHAHLKSSPLQGRACPAGQSWDSYIMSMGLQEPSRPTSHLTVSETEAWGGR